jgi:RNA polymerase-binding transcription factor DksA
MLERLGETERAELARVDDALARMERGAYEECVNCRAPIEIDRLEAVPETDRCVRCAER